MRTGHFGFIHQIDTIASAGFDTAELHMWEIMALDEAQFAAARRKVRDCAVPCEVFNNPLPMDISIADPGFDQGRWREHMKKGVDRVHALGGRCINFGNGRARSIPEGREREGAVQKNLEVIGALCDLAAPAEIAILLEPIGEVITNFVRTLPEAIDCAQQLGKQNLQTLLDLRWFLDAGHTWDDIETYAAFIAHAHIDYPLSTLPQRVEPTLSDGYDYAPFFAALQKAGYDGIISTETNTHENFSGEIRRGLQLYRHHMSGAKG